MFEHLQSDTVHISKYTTLLPKRFLCHHFWNLFLTVTPVNDCTHTLLHILLCCLLITLGGASVWRMFSLKSVTLQILIDPVAAEESAANCLLLHVLVHWHIFLSFLVSYNSAKLFFVWVYQIAALTPACHGVPTRQVTHVMLLNECVMPVTAWLNYFPVKCVSLCLLHRAEEEGLESCRLTHSKGPFCQFKPTFWDYVVQYDLLLAELGCILSETLLMSLPMFVRVCCSTN